MTYQLRPSDIFCFAILKDELLDNEAQDIVKEAEDEGRHHGDNDDKQSEGDGLLARGPSYMDELGSRIADVLDESVHFY
jgi:hypothetical protein